LTSLKLQNQASQDKRLANPKSKIQNLKSERLAFLAQVKQNNKYRKKVGLSNE
jgi:hypothetical protein